AGPPGAGRPRNPGAGLRGRVFELSAACRGGGRKIRPQDRGHSGRTGPSPHGGRTRRHDRRRGAGPAAERNRLNGYRGPAEARRAPSGMMPKTGSSTSPDQYNNRRQAMKKTTVAALVAGLFMAVPAAHADITIGFSGVLSGPQGVLGQDQRDGFMLAMEQLGGKFGDQKVNVVIEDDQLKPDVGAQIVQKFLERDKVDAIVGLGFSNVLMAELRRIKDSGVVAIATNAGPAPVAGKLCTPNLFGLAWQN